MLSATRVSDDTDEGKLLQELRAGDPKAFEKLVRAFGGRLLAAAQRLLGNEEDARDAVQDAYLSAFRALAQFDGRARFSTWLHRIVINAALERLRTQKRKPTRSVEELLPAFLEDGHQAHRAVEWREVADVQLQRQETRQLIRNAIDQLPDSYRTVLLLRDIEELDTEETARLLGVTREVVKTRLHRARQALRTLLDPHYRRDVG